MGSEISFLMNSGVLTSQIHQEQGIIPYWNPYLGDGEPLIEGAFSYVLNPLMFLPTYLFSVAQSSKIIMLIHIFVMGFGGWVLGHTLGLRMAGRLLMTFLLAGSGSFSGGSLQFQMAISQAYIPWVIAGLWGVIHTTKRRYQVLFVIAFYLFITAGTYWYVLPTVIAGMILVVCNLYAPNARYYINWGAVKRLSVVGTFTLGISAIRWYPQLELHKYVLHPSADFRDNIFNFFTVLRRYFYVEKDLFVYLIQVNYHYIVPPIFAITLLLVRFCLPFQRMIRGLPKARWKILIPSLMSFILFVLWAQEGTSLVRWFYERIPLLTEWRILGRMLAAGTVWLVILIAVSFDDILRLISAQKWTKHWQQMGQYVGVIALGIVGIMVSIDVLHNWRRVSGVEPNMSFTSTMLAPLREQVDDELLTVYTNGFTDYFPFYEQSIRAGFGNPDIRMGGASPTIGGDGLMFYPIEYAIGSHEVFVEHLFLLGYEPFGENVSEDGQQILWRDPDSPSYAFMIDHARLVDRDVRIFRSETQSIENYTHNVNSIDLELDDYPVNSVVVLRERAVPGWRVLVDNQPARLESIDGFIGVRLPFTGVSQVRFEYVPTRFFTGVAITLMSVVGFLVYLFRHKFVKSFNRLRTGA